MDSFWRWMFSRCVRTFWILCRSSSRFFSFNLYAALTTSPSIGSSFSDSDGVFVLLLELA